LGRRCSAGVLVRGGRHVGLERDVGEAAVTLRAPVRLVRA